MCIRDSAKAYSSRVISLFDEPEFKAVGAWAFGIMRGVDYLVQDADVDAARIADIGHSRLGKAAVWAGAVSYTHLDVYKRQVLM